MADIRDGHAVFLDELDDGDWAYLPAAGWRGPFEVVRYERPEKPLDDGIVVYRDPTDRRRHLHFVVPSSLIQAGAIMVPAPEES